MPLAGLGGCLETYFWQTPHSMIPLASWMAVWCTNTGYSVSQGCSRSCFLCLWAAGDRGMCARRGYHTSQKASGSPATRVTPFSLLQVVRDTADQHSAKLQQSVEALLCCCGVRKPCHAAVLPFPGPLRFISRASEGTVQHWGPKTSTHFTFYSPAGKEAGKEGKAPGTILSTQKWGCNQDTGFARSHKE